MTLELYRTHTHTHEHMPILNSFDEITCHHIMEYNPKYAAPRFYLCHIRINCLAALRPMCHATATLLPPWRSHLHRQRRHHHRPTAAFRRKVEDFAWKRCFGKNTNHCGGRQQPWAMALSAYACARPPNAHVSKRNINKICPSRYCVCLFRWSSTIWPDFELYYGAVWFHHFAELKVPGYGMLNVTCILMHTRPANNFSDRILRMRDLPLLRSIHVYNAVLCVCIMECNGLNDELCYKVNIYGIFFERVRPRRQWPNMSKTFRGIIFKRCHY